MADSLIAEKRKQSNSAEAHNSLLLRIARTYSDGAGVALNDREAVRFLTCRLYLSPHKKHIQFKVDSIKEERQNYLNGLSEAEESIQ